MSDINFFLKEKEKDITSVEAIIRFGGERFKMQTRVSVLTRYWNPETYRYRLVREYPDAKDYQYPAWPDWRPSPEIVLLVV